LKISGWNTVISRKSFRKPRMLHNKFDPAMRITAKLKLSRKHLKEWQKNLPKLSQTVDNTKLLIQFSIQLRSIETWRFKNGIFEGFFNISQH
jgi:hypothetical protein